jgi:hypothetical protein
MKSACEACPAGFYGADADRLICQPGTPGYVFEIGATVARPLNVTTEHGYICPTGAYCPAESTKPLLCSIGSYQPLLGQGNASSCLLCQSGYYLLVIYFLLLLIFFYTYAFLAGLYANIW